MLKNEKRVGVLIPVHPPKFKFLEGIFNTFDPLGEYELIFVFTFKNEFLLAQGLFPKIEQHNIICLDECFTNINFDFDKIKGVVTVKKFLGLWYCEKRYKQFDYIVCIDSEIEFRQTKNLYDSIQFKYDQKKILGWRTVAPGVAAWTEQSSQCFQRDDDEEKISLIFEGNKIYTWWSDLPFYKVSDLPDFFNSILFPDRVSYYTNFDHILYQMFLILKRNFTLVVVSDLPGIHGIDFGPLVGDLGLEYGNEKLFTKLEHNPIMSHKYFYNESAKCFQNIWILFHCDYGRQ